MKLVAWCIILTASINRSVIGFLIGVGVLLWAYHKEG